MFAGWERHREHSDFRLSTSSHSCLDDVVPVGVAIPSVRWTAAKRTRWMGRVRLQRPAARHAAYLGSEHLLTSARWDECRPWHGLRRRWNGGARLLGLLTHARAGIRRRRRLAGHAPTPAGRVFELVRVLMMIRAYGEALERLFLPILLGLGHLEGGGFGLDAVVPRGS